MGGCNGKRARYTQHHDDDARAAHPSGAPQAAGIPAASGDDIICDLCDLGQDTFAAAGVDGGLYIGGSSWLKRWEAHKKASNRVRLLSSKAEAATLASASMDATVKIWTLYPNHTEPPAEPNTCAEVAPPPVTRTLTGHEMSVSALCEPSPGALVTGSRDCSVKLWDVETGSELQSTKILRNITLSLSSAGERGVVQTGEDLRVRLWDLARSPGPVLEAQEHSQQLLCSVVHGHSVFVGSKGFNVNDCFVAELDLRKDLQQVWRTEQAFSQTVERVATDGARIFALSKDGKLASYHMASKELEKSVDLPFGSALACLGDRRVVAASHRQLQLVELK